MEPVLAAEEALSNPSHLVVVFHHLQQDTLPRKLLGLENVLAKACLESSKSGLYKTSTFG